MFLAQGTSRRRYVFVFRYRRVGSETGIPRRIHRLYFLRRRNRCFRRRSSVREDKKKKKKKKQVCACNIKIVAPKCGEEEAC